MPITASDRKAKTQPYIFKNFEASTGHILKTDTMLLNKEHDSENPLVVYKYEYGWFVYVGGGRLGKTEQDRIHAYGYSKALLDLILLAGKNDCKFLALDADGFVYSDLPTFDW